MKTLSWIASIISIIGLVLNAWQSLWCWPVWLLANFIWIHISIREKNTPQLVLWIVFQLFNLYGWYCWTIERVLH